MMGLLIRVGAMAKDKGKKEKKKPKKDKSAAVVQPTSPITIDR